MKGYVDCVVGLQFGSEGKGKVVNYLANEYDMAIRAGAPNAGHTFYTRKDRIKYVMRHIPCVWTNPGAKLYLAAGALINLVALQDEIDTLPPGIISRLATDVNTGVITEEDMAAEQNANMFGKIGSTCEGVGEAQSRKILRRNGLVVGQIGSFPYRITNVASEVNLAINSGARVMIEGTQGFGLCVNHGTYPYTTSRDVLASSLLSDSGLAPSLCRNVIGVMRTYPIRVAGNSGQLKNELDWERVKELSGSKEDIVERTTVTKRIRRVSEIDWDLLHQAVLLNRPSYVFITFLDYINAEDKGCGEYRKLSQKSKDFISYTERKLDVKVGYVSTGPFYEDTIELF